MLGTTSNGARVGWVGAAAAAVFIVRAAADPSASAGLGFFYAVPVGLATWWGGWRAGGIAVVACCALYVAGGLIEPIPNFWLSLGARLGAFVGVVAVVTVLRDRLKVLESSTEDLEAIQAALTPSRLVERPDVDAAASFVPSEHGVSGDFYLLTSSPDGSTVAIVGDVVGHGPDAARLATFIRARFAAFAANTSDPAELLSLANGALVDRPGSDHEVVSAVCLRYSARDDTLSWAIAGHPPPLHLPGLLELGSKGHTFLLGVDSEFELETTAIALDNGDGVLLYTDGATDVRRGDSLLGVEGLSRLLAPHADAPAAVIVEHAEEAILDWADEPIKDDVCVLALRPKRAA